MNKQRHIRESGQGGVEYALLLILVALVVMSALQLSGASLPHLYLKSICAIQGGDNCLAEALYYMNEFDDDLTGWTVGVWRNHNRQWWVEGGRLVSERNAGILLDDFEGDDFSIVIHDLELTNKSKVWQGVTVHFRTENKDGKLTGYSYRVQKRPDGDYGYFQKWQNSKPVWPAISSMDPLPPGFDWSNPGDIQVDVEGDTFTAYINGQQLSQAQDSTFTEGQVGLGTHNNSSASIESFEIKRLEK